MTSDALETPLGAGPAARPPLAPAPAAGVLGGLRAVWRELRLAERHALGADGLPPAQAHVLDLLGTRRASSLRELARRAHADDSSVSVVVQRLVELGLVARVVARTDRRRTELELTTSGRAWLTRREGSVEHRVQDAIARMGPGGAEELAHRLDRLADAFRSARATPRGARARAGRASAGGA